MKIRNLVIVFGLCALGFISCSKEETQLPDIAEKEIELRGEDNGPENCCDFNWSVLSAEQNEFCCVYEIRVTNYANCQIHITGFPNGFVAPFTSKTFEVNVCAKGSVTYNVYADANQTSTLCGTIELSPDCTTETPCDQDCVIQLELEDQGTEVQIANSLRIGVGCDFFTLDYLYHLVLVFKNDSDCTDAQVMGLWNINNPNNNLSLISLTDYTNLLEEVIQGGEGCADAQINVVINDQGGLEIEISYDCATCEVYFILPAGLSYNVNNECTEITGSIINNFDGGDTNCGACD